MESLDLEKALQGHPVRLRNGEKAYIRHQEVEFPVYKELFGFREPNSGIYVPVSWNNHGKNTDTENLDIVGMWKSAPLVFLYWGEIKRVYNYIAKDKDGEWWAYANKPTRIDHEYYYDINDGECTSLRALSNKIFTDCDWKDSLMERPR